MGSPHATAVTLVQAVLYPLLVGSNYFRRCQLPLALGDRSEPEPDIAIVRGNIRDFTQKHPSQAGLVLEISDTTLEFDRQTKGSLYAKAGIPHYWILNLTDRCLERWQSPQRHDRARYGWHYGARSVAAATESVSLPEAIGGEVAVAALLP